VRKLALVTGVYDNPTKKAYLQLLDYEAFTVQMAEIHKQNGFIEEASAVLRVKQEITIMRVCMKAALRLKEKADRAATPSATKNNIFSLTV
jgi:2-oxo-4-hydroxy-4-carboxy--5-ureidoimidazoline (OHCU) decarboxylase